MKKNHTFQMIRFLVAEGLFALLCVLRFWDRRMVGHTFGFGLLSEDAFIFQLLQNYYVMVVATAVYFLCVLLFSGWVMRWAKESVRSSDVAVVDVSENGADYPADFGQDRSTKFSLSFLALFLFPAFLSENYFGAADIFAIILFLLLFVIFTKASLSIVWLAVAFSLLQLPLLSDATKELTLPRFIITAIFFLVILIYWKQSQRLPLAVFMGLPLAIVWAVLGDYDRGLFSLMMGFEFAWLYMKPTTQKDKSLLPIVLLVCIALFVIFWMYGEPLLLEEEILEY